MEKIKETLDYINSKTNNLKPEVAIILGSGLGCFCDDLDGIRIKYSDIPHFGSSDVKGHKGELLFCEIAGKQAVIMQGRFHFYEGNSLQVATYPIKIFKQLGVRTLFITNAAGALHKGLNVGDIMLMNDHINFMGTNPLIGENDSTLGERFPDMSEIYDKKLREIVIKTAEELNIKLQQGVYIQLTGPNFESPAEVRMCRILGADAVGMSTACETITANHAGMKICGISCVANLGCGLTENPLTHKEVMEAADKAAPLFKKLIRTSIVNIHNSLN